MMRNTSNERPHLRAAVRLGRPGERVLLDRSGLAWALGVSLRTVDRMLAAEELVCIRMHGGAVRFYLPDVLEDLRANSRKWGREAGPEKLKVEMLKAEMETRKAETVKAEPSTNS